MKSRICKNAFDSTAPPGCLGVPDEKYTMRFDSIGEPPIYWCSFCGPEAKKINDAIESAFATRPGFAADFERALNKVEKVES